MTLLYRPEAIVTDRHRIPVNEVVYSLYELKHVHTLCEKFMLTQAELWEILDAYMDHVCEEIHGLEIEFEDFDRDRVIDQDVSLLEVKMISQDMFASLVCLGHDYDPSQDDFHIMSQLGMLHTVLDCLEYLIYPEDNQIVESSVMHFHILAAMEQAYQEDLHADCGFIYHRLQEQLTEQPDQTEETIA